MILKPKSTTLNTKALLYRRFTSIEKSINLNALYYTVSDGQYWTFDNNILQFNAIILEQIPSQSTIISIEDNTMLLQYLTNYFKYDGNSWVSGQISEGVSLLNAKFNNIAKYQTNRYYFVGSFDYTIKGSIDGTTTQFIKGNKMALTSLNIKYFNDEFPLSVDDLVVIDNRLYSVENPEIVKKRMPKPFNIYFATLNSIL